MIQNEVSFDREAVFLAYIDKYEPTMHVILRKLGVCENDIDDVKQTSLMRMWSGLHQLESEGAMLSWTYTIMRNEAYQYYYSLQRHYRRMNAMADSLDEHDALCYPNERSMEDCIDSLSASVGPALATLAFARVAGFRPRELWPDVHPGNSKSILIRNLNTVRKVLNNEVLSKQDRKRIQLSFSAPSSWRGRIRSLRPVPCRTNARRDSQGRLRVKSSTTSGSRRTDNAASELERSGDLRHYRGDC